MRSTRAQCGGDLCVLVSADERPIDELAGARLRWEQRGTHGERGALGFREGTFNPRRPLDLDRHVWVTGRERSWMVGGTFLVVRRHPTSTTAWSSLSAGTSRSSVIGRHQRSGAPLGGRTSSRIARPTTRSRPTRTSGRRPAHDAGAPSCGAATTPPTACCSSPSAATRAASTSRSSAGSREQRRAAPVHAPRRQRGVRDPTRRAPPELPREPLLYAQ